MKVIGQILLFLTLAAVFPALAQQRVRGKLPDGLYEIDQDKVANWSGATFEKAAQAKEFSTRRVEALSLQQWDHEFPSRRSAVAAEAVDLEDVTPQAWPSPKVKGIEPKHLKYLEDRATAKPSAFGGPALNEKWAGLASKDFEKTAVIERNPDFMAKVGIRPLEERELQEKLNQYSSPPGQRTKGSPLQPQTSSKH